MALTDRQTKLYTDTAYIYKPTVPSGTTAEGFAKDRAYASVATGVACKFFRRGETAEAIKVGRMAKESDYQMDRFHFEASVEIKDEYLIYISNASSPYAGWCWIVSGEPTKRGMVTGAIRRPNYQMVFVRHILPTPRNIVFPAPT